MTKITPELLERVNCGDHQACMDVVTLHLPLLNKLAYKYKLPDIVTQGWYDTVLTLENSIGSGNKFKSAKDLTGYITQTMRGRSVYIKKHDTLTPNKKLTWMQIPHEFLAAPSELGVKESLDCIPDGPFRAIAYRKYLGQAVTEIATALGMSKRTVYYYLHQIKELLRDKT